LDERRAGSGPAARTAAPANPPAEAIDRRTLGRVMLPLRVFLGVTFVYAGLVKLADPAFLDSAAAGSLVEQLHGFARDSPLAPLITTIAIPLATPIGVLIAVGEIAVGLGALLGLCGRLTAWGGFTISALFFLTASWATRPYFYGPDLPYAAGWLTLALAGDGGYHVFRGRSFARRASAISGTDLDEWSPDRRAFLEMLTLGVAAIAVAGVASLRLAWLQDLLGSASTVASQTPPPSGSPSAVSAPTSRPVAAGPSRKPAGVAIGTVQAVTSAGSASFVVPGSGDPGVLVRLASGSIVAFDAVCTHAGCTVEYVPQDLALECPCHGAVFDPAHAGAVLAGPTFQPLLGLPITIDHATGEIRLVG
jgi:thiosulfate dehydrogenase [quinone] large subunit